MPPQVDLVRCAKRLDVEEFTVAAAKVLLHRAHAQHTRSSEAVVTASLLCHQLVLEGSPVLNLGPDTLVWLKYKMLWAMFVVVNRDKNSSLSRQEFLHLLTMKGANKTDAALVFDALARVGSAEAKAAEAEDHHHHSPTFFSIMSHLFQSGWFHAGANSEAEHFPLTVEAFCRALAMEDRKFIEALENAVRQADRRAHAGVRRLRIDLQG